MDRGMKIAVIVPLLFTVIAVPFLAYSVISERGQQIREDQTIESMYIRAEVYIDKGDFETAEGIYTDIIQRDATQEKAWHEKGKILNRFEQCAEAVQYYDEYLKLFPESLRGLEGYAIAKRC